MAENEGALLRQDIQNLFEKYHENSVKLAKIEVLVDEAKKKIHGLRGMLEVISTTNNETASKLKNFETTFEFSKEKILEDLENINTHIQATNHHLNRLKNKMETLEKSSQFKEWLWQTLGKNYRLLGLCIVGISLTTIVLYELHWFPSILKFFQ